MRAASSGSPGRTPVAGFRALGLALLLPCGALAAPSSGVAVFAAIINPPAIAVRLEQAGAPAVSGDAVIYRIIVTNSGLATITALRVLDTIAPAVTGAAGEAPPGMTAASATASPGGTLFDWNGSGIVLAPGQTFTFTVAGIAGGVGVPTTVADAALITAATPAGTTIMTTGVVSFVLAPTLVAGGIGSLASHLTVSRDPGAVGEPATFVLAVHNTGTGTVTNVSASLRADGRATIAAPAPAAVAMLAPGASVTFTWTADPADASAMTFFGVAAGFTTSGTGTVAITSAPAACELPGLKALASDETYVFPSPAHQTAGVAYTMAESGTVRIRVYNAAGALVDFIDEAKPEGTQSTIITTARMAPGVYFYLLERRYGSGRLDRISTHKFVVTH